MITRADITMLRAVASLALSAPMRMRGAHLAAQCLDLAGRLAPLVTEPEQTEPTTPPAA